jgi:hypothetical protein
MSSIKGGELILKKSHNSKLKQNDTLLSFHSIPLFSSYFMMHLFHLLFAKYTFNFCSKIIS